MSVTDSNAAARRPLRVLHVIPSVSAKHGGPSVAVRSFSKAAHLFSLEIVVATTDDDGGTSRLEVPIATPVSRDEVIHIFFKRTFLPYKISLGLRFWLNTHVREFDIVHIHALFSFSSLVAARAAREHNVPYIVRPLGVLNRWGMKQRRPFLKRLSFRLIELPILKRAAAIHYTSEAERSEAEELNKSISRQRVMIVPIPLDVRVTPVEPMRDGFVQRHPEIAGRTVILFLSRITPKKGIDLLLQAFAALEQTHPDTALVIAGEGECEYVTSLQAQARRLGVQNRILWAGFLGPDDKAQALSAATVFVLPSYSENFGIAVAEAMAAGVPTIISDRVGIASHAAQHVAAEIVRPEVADLQRGLLLVLSDSFLRKQLSEKGREFAKNFFSPQSVGASLSAHYTQIVADFHKGG